MLYSRFRINIETIAMRDDDSLNSQVKIHKTNEFLRNAITCIGLGRKAW